MNRYQEWAAKNLPVTVDGNDPDRFVEYSQADLDAYAERAFQSGGKYAFQYANTYYRWALLGWAAFIVTLLFFK